MNLKMNLLVTGLFKYLVDIFIKMVNFLGIGTFKVLSFQKAISKFLNSRLTSKVVAEIENMWKLKH